MLSENEGIECYDDSQDDEWIHIDDVEPLYEAEIYAKDIAKALYETGSLFNLESALENLLDIYGHKLPTTKPKLMEGK